MRRRDGEAAMGRMVFARVGTRIDVRRGVLAAAAVLTLATLLLLAGSLLAREAAAETHDQSATMQMTIAGCDNQKVQMKLREYEVFKQHNAYRTQKGLPTFCVDPTLQQVAQGHSTDMATRDFFSHTNPDGKGPTARVSATGYSCYPYGAENIGAVLPEDTSSTVMQLWIDSDGHRANVERAGSVRIGIGSANDADFGEWYYGNASYGEYVNYTVNFAGNDCAAPPEDDGGGTDPGDGDTDPGDGDGGTDPAPNTAAPTISNLRPSAGAKVRDATPRFSAVVKDSQTDLDKGDVSVYVDGRRFYRFSYSSATDKVSGVSRKLKSGKLHTIKIVADDGEGKSSVKSTRFVVR